MKFGFKHRQQEPEKFGFKHRKTKHNVKFGFKHRQTPGPNRLGVSIYEAIQHKAQRHVELERENVNNPAFFDGSSAHRACKPVTIPSLLQTMGFKEDVCIDEYLECMDAFHQGLFTGHGGETAYRSARASIGRLGSIPYSWRRWI